MCLIRRRGQRTASWLNSCLREKRWFVLKIPRGDTNGVGEHEMTVTSGLHAKAARINKQKIWEGATWPYPVEVQTKVQNRAMLLNHLVAPLVAECGLCRFTDNLSVQGSGLRTR